MSALRAFEPSSANPWDRAAAAHLLRRAGFCPSERELRTAVEAGPREMVRGLLADGADCERFNELDELGEALALRENIEGLRGWWLLRMCRTARPLRARMALLWHNHFATSNAKVRSAALMLKQLRTFERLGLGRFEALAVEVARDPAMIVWLDGGLNTKGRPNENFARELFELFMLGVGNYGESDIREAARAFTGWQQRDGAFHFAAREHDEGEKVIFGERGAWDGADVMRLALGRPACADFLAKKLLSEFVCPAPPAELVEEFAGVLRGREFDLRAALESLLTSAAFFDLRWRRARISSPAEFVVGVVRALELHVPAERLAQAVSQMGQRLFEPPSVAGWAGQRTWLNAATMLVRLNAAGAAANSEGFDPAALCAKYAIAYEAAARGFALRLLMQDERCAPLVGQLEALRGSAPEVLRESARVVLSSPEFQLV